MLTQIDSAVPDISNWQDETQIKSLSIDNGILTVNILILSEADKQLPHYQQQASVPKTVQYKLINGKLVLQQPNETASWKTYTNTQYGFEIKYPKDWQIGYQSNSFAHFYKGTLHGTIGEGAELNIFFNIDNLTLENLIKYTQRPDDQREDFNINGIKAVKLIGKIYQPTEVPIPIEKSLEEKLLVVKDNVKFEIIIDALGQDYQNYLETFNQIISTFKFTK